MITHENLVQAVYEDINDWSCEGCRTCNVNIDCISCSENKVIEYENAIREEGKQMALADLTEHDKEVIRKFAEWAYDHSIIDVVRTKEARIAKYIEEYEKQMKEGGKNG